MPWHDSGMTPDNVIAWFDEIAEQKVTLHGEVRHMIEGILQFVARTS